jgi:hypothetical protein
MTACDDDGHPPAMRALGAIARRLQPIGFAQRDVARLDLRTTAHRGAAQRPIDERSALGSSPA